MKKVTTGEEASKWIKENWNRLLKTNKLGEALKHYYKLVHKTAGEAFGEVKKMMPDEKI